MSNTTVFLHAHKQAVNTFSGLFRTILGALPINPSEKAAALTALDVVQNTADGLDENVGSVIGDFASEEAKASAINSAIVTPVLSPTQQAVKDAEEALAKAQAAATEEAASASPTKGV